MLEALKVFGGIATSIRLRQVTEKCSHEVSSISMELCGGHV